MRQIERLYRDLAETSNDLIWAVDADGHITFLSSACRKIYGREPEEMIGRSFLEFVPPDQYQKDLLHFTEALQSGQETVDYISRVYRKDGSIVTLSANARIVYDEKGRAIGGHGISRDMTESLRAREAQETSDREQRELVAQLETERARLRDSLRQLHDVSARLNVIREQERARMAREIHDNLGQALTALKMDVAEVGRRLKAADTAAVDQRLREMSALIDASADDVRRVAMELRPVILDDLGLVAAIRVYLNDVERRVNVPCVLTTELSEVQMADERATAIFRILQEALTNAVRHAAAQRIDVSLVADSEVVRLVVRDDGCGIPPLAQRNSRALGLVGMRDRALLFGGDVAVTGGPGEGTTVTAHLPMG